ncbi:LuxE/PaaK family acyltransferase [Enterococcus olivae]
MEKEIQKFISQSENEKGFNDLALQLFEYLYRNNPAYQQFCRRKGIGVRQIQHWKEIPSVSTEAFKTAFLSVAPEKECRHVFMTSGTTTGNKGKHYHQNLETYDLSVIRGFEQFVSKQKLPMAILFPHELEMPNSSLAHYLTLLKEEAHSESAHFVSKKGLELEKFIHWVKTHQGTPVMILGASYNYVHLFEALEETGQSLELHEESLIFDTGGFKNFSRAYSEKEFYEKVIDIFKIKTKPVNMYGMTELSSQYYTVVDLQENSIKRAPHWVRFKIIDPVTGQEVPKGEAGLLVHIDLANINSVPAVQTGDLAIERDNGFELLGRQTSAEPKGCSLSAQQWLEEYQNDTN